MSQADSGLPRDNAPDDVLLGERQGIAATSPIVALPSPDEGLFVDWESKIDSPPRRLERLTVRFVEGGKRPIRISEQPQD
jgi:hypothetical protein